VKFLGKYDISRVVGRKVVPQLPNARQQNEMRISCDAQVDEIVESLISARCGEDSLLGETSQHLCDLKIQ